MASTKPKIQGYVEPHLHQRYLDWMKEHTIDSHSQALNQIFSVFFNEPLSPPEASIDEEKIRAIVEDLLPSREDIRIEIQEQLWNPAEAKNDFIEGLKFEAQEIISKAVSEEKAYWQAVGASGEEIKLAIAQLNQRIEALENHGLAKTVADLCAEYAALKKRVDELTKQPFENSLSGNQLAKRLSTNPGTLIKNRAKTNFEQWTAAKDPEGMGWRYAEDVQRYEPIG